MKNKERLTFMATTELFHLRDAIRVILVYFDFKVLKDLQKDIHEQLTERQERGG